MRMNIEKALNLSIKSKDYKIGVNTYFGNMYLGSRIDNIIEMLEGCKIDIKLASFSGRDKGIPTVRIDPSRLVVKVVSKCNEEHTLGFIVNPKTGIVYGIYENSMWVPQRLLENLNKGYGEPKHFTDSIGSKKLATLELMYIYNKSVYGNTIVYNRSWFSRDEVLLGITVIGKDLVGFSEYFDIPEAVWTTRDTKSTKYKEYITGYTLDKEYPNLNYNLDKIEYNSIANSSEEAKKKPIQKAEDYSRESIIENYRKTKNEDVQREYTLIDVMTLKLPPSLLKQDGKSIDMIVREFLESATS